GGLAGELASAASAAGVAGAAGCPVARAASFGPALAVDRADPDGGGERPACGKDHRRQGPPSPPERSGSYELLSDYSQAREQEIPAAATWNEFVFATEMGWP